MFRKLGPHLGPEVTRKVPPANARELISEFRALLRKQRSYAFRPKGAGGGTWLKSGDALAVQTLGLGGALAPGDVLLSWIPGRDARRGRPRLPPRCPRAVRATPRSTASCSAASRWSRATASGGRCRARVGDLARSFGPLVALPMLRMAGR